MNVEKVAQKISQIVGEDYVKTDPGTLYVYSRDMTENEPSMPDAVAMPGSVEEIKEIVLLANKEKFAVTPFVSGSNVGGLAIPTEGGVILDLKRMNRIIEVNEDEMYILIEPGVTFGHIKTYLEKNHPDLIYSYPLAPPFTSVMCNALLDGLNNLSTRHGAMSEWINSIEAVLPTGEVVKCGAGAVSDSWFGRVPMPDLVGLFVGWQGITGIVTKISLQLWPKPPYLSRSIFLLYNLPDAFKLTQTLSKTLIFDEISGLSWVAAKMMFVREGSVTLSPGEPEYYLFLEYSGNSNLELRSKRLTLNRIIRSFKRDGANIDGPLDVSSIVEYFPQYSKVAELPTSLDFLLDWGGGGLTWVGSFGPTSRYEAATKRCYSLLEEKGVPPLLVTRSMKEGHYHVLRFIISFNKKSKKEIKMVRILLTKLSDALLDEGFIPYKPPGWAAKRILQRSDPNFVELLKKIKTTLDPNRIMNPGRWGI